MTTPDPTSHLRIARPTADLAAQERFWCAGVGMEVQWRSEPTPLPGHHDLLMVALAGAAWHLELVADAEAAAAARPSTEDLLVLYLGDALEDALVDRIVAAGGRRVTARNPYWEEWGVTLEDPDGYRLVLSHRSWG